MSKILVVPDTHLKPKMFDLADKILREHKVDYVIQLGDNVDDFYCYGDQYRNHNARMLTFYRDYPNTIWLWGNHEASYILGRPVTGNIFAGREYARLYRENFNPKFIHLDGKVMFSHAGIFQKFIDENNLQDCKNAEELVQRTNQLNLLTLWRDNSPLWARPQYDGLTKPKLIKDCLQVVGHTPMKGVIEMDSVVFVDVFSTSWGKKYGIEKMIIVDTEEPSFEAVDIDYRKEFGEGR
ncbi:metallophosphoesterase [Candidatus Saccharibacteria bacterium]|nr:metallophosphoesterase [Candidatus Saccharibacteria bacterium]